MWTTANYLDLAGLIAELMAALAVVLSYQAQHIRGVLGRIIPAFETRWGDRLLLLIIALASGGVVYIISFASNAANQSYLAWLALPIGIIIGVLVGNALTHLSWVKDQLETILTFAVAVFGLGVALQLASFLIER